PELSVIPGSIARRQGKDLGQALETAIKPELLREGAVAGGEVDAQLLADGVEIRVVGLRRMPVPRIVDAADAAEGGVPGPFLTGSGHRGSPVRTEHVQAATSAPV